MEIKGIRGAPLLSDQILFLQNPISEEAVCLPVVYLQKLPAMEEVKNRRGKSLVFKFKDSPLFFHTIQ